jgi:HEAT repeat protein
MESEIKRKIADLLTSEDADTRRLAAEELADVRDPATTTALTTALQDSSKGVRDAAFRSLIAHGDSTVARSIAHYIADTNIVTRNLVSKLLIRMGQVAVPALLPFLRDPDKDVRKFAVDILGEIRSEDPVYHLLPLLKDPDPNIIVSTLEALGNIGSPESLDAIFRVYDAHPFARASAADALGRIADPGASNFLLTRFSTAIAEPPYDPIVLIAVVEALGAVGGPDAAELLREHLETTQGKLLHVVVHALVQITERLQGVVEFPPFLRGTLLEAIADDDDGIRLSAAKGLARFEGEDVTRALVKALGISEEFDFFLISELLGRTESFRVAVEALEESDTRKAAPIALLLGKLAYEYVCQFSEVPYYAVTDELLYRAFDAILMKWGESDHETRAILVDSMFRLSGDRAVECVSEIVADPDPWLRVHVIEILAVIPDRRAVDVVRMLAEEEDEMVSESARAVLESRGIRLESCQAGGLAEEGMSFGEGKVHAS